MDYKIVSVFISLLFVGSLNAADESLAALDTMPAGTPISQTSTLYLSQIHSSSEITSQDNGPTSAKDDHPYTFSMGQNWRGVFSPGAILYPHYIANPIRPMIALNVTGVNDNEIAETGDSRYVFRLGGRIGLLRMHPAGSPDRGFQLDLEGCFLGVFDRDNSLDNIGWDGVYGALFTWSNGNGLAAKLAIQHDSSHVGDEYIERTGRQRINYTRQEYALGLSLRGLKYWRIYGEAGWAFDIRNEELQKEWRLEGGLEFEDPARFWNGKAGYYAAVDIMSYEESDWKTDVTVQTGFVLPKSQVPRTWRIGLEYRKGRSVIGEFFQNRESHIAFGLWLDF